MSGYLSVLEETMADFNNTDTVTTALANDADGTGSELSGEQQFVIFFRILIYVAGVTGNLLVIFVILFLSEFRKLSHWYVLQLALADILFLQTLPFKISEALHGRWIYPVELCQAVTTILFFNYYASILFLMIMAIDRYLAVCHALSSRVQRLRTLKYAYFTTGLTWAIALIMCIPVMLYSDSVGIYPSCVCTLQFPKDPLQWCTTHMNGSVETCLNTTFHDIHEESCSLPTYNGSDSSDTTDDDDYNVDWFELGSGSLFSGLGENDLDQSGVAEYFKPGCLYDHERTGWAYFVYFNFIVMFIIPLLVISACYAMIVLRLKSTHASVRRDSNAQSTKSKDSTKKIWKPSRRKSSSASTGRSFKEKQKVTIMCAVLVLLFVVCWLPFHTVHLTKLEGIHTESETFCGRLAIATSLLAYLNSAFNPYLYNFLGTFQKRLKQISNHRRMQSFLSATGLTRVVGGRSSSIVSSDGSRSKRPSFPNDSRSASIPNERIPLKTMDADNKSTMA